MSLFSQYIHNLMLQHMSCNTKKGKIVQARLFSPQSILKQTNDWNQTSTNILRCISIFKHTSFPFWCYNTVLQLRYCNIKSAMAEPEH